MDIEVRLKRVERMNRLLLALLLVTLGTAAASHAHSKRTGKIVANSVVTHSLDVINPTGKQAVHLFAGKDGMVGIEMTTTDGKEAVGLATSPSGQPTLCLSYHDVCRVAIGAVYRINTPEMSIQLRGPGGHTIWMPTTSNPFSLSGQYPPHQSR